MAQPLRCVRQACNHAWRNLCIDAWRKPLCRGVAQDYAKRMVKCICTCMAQAVRIVNCGIAFGRARQPQPAALCTNRQRFRARWHPVVTVCACVCVELSRQVELRMEPVTNLYDRDKKVHAGGSVTVTTPWVFATRTDVSYVCICRYICVYCIYTYIHTRARTHR